MIDVKRTATLVGFSGVMFVACRGVIGVEDLELVDGGAATSSGASSGSMMTRDGAASSSGASSGSTSSSSGALMACAMNCRSGKDAAYGLLLKFARENAPCLCDMANCGAATFCGATTVCASPPTGTPSMACNACVEQKLKGPGCAAARNLCRNDMTCDDVLPCFECL